MEEYRDRIEKQEPEKPSRAGRGSWVVMVAGTSIVATCLAIGYGYHQQTLVSQLTLEQRKPRT
jgi:hypothetical protein